jgi:glycosyltransferase involved in cell wall biosynthesis
LRVLPDSTVPVPPSAEIPPPRAAPLRIALFTGNYVHIEDGVSRTLGRLVGFLVGEGHEVLVLGPTVAHPAVTQPGRFLAVPSVAAPGRPEYRLSTGFPRAARRAVAAFRPDVVHIATPDVLGHRALTWARRQGLPVLTTYHTHFASYLRYYGLGLAEPALWALGRRFYNRCDEVHVPTPTMEADLRAHGIKAPIHLFPRGIERDRFSPDKRSAAWRSQHGIGPDEAVVAFVSRLVKEKGLDVFASVVERLRAEGQPVRALVVGDGPEREALAAALPGGVLTGHLGGDELATAYACSDVFLFPSETETFGNVTLEAMASGLAVVCADAAGSRSLVSHGQTGLLCPPRDTDAFASAARSLVEDPTHRATLGQAARDASAAYDWSEILHRLLAAYRRLAARP